MALKKIFCPECGNETQINDEKEFGFCIQCGAKININKNEETKATPDKLQSETNDKCANQEIERRLEEVAFYYQLSQEKKEYEDYKNDPKYYIKAQDILIDLSQVYPDDFRIWWELCKPVDFINPFVKDENSDVYCINEDYFNKALDKAGIEQKRRLIKEHDNYVEKKENLKKEFLKKKEELARLEQERKEKEKSETERLEQERFDREQQENEKREEEKKKKAEEDKKNRAAIISSSEELWSLLEHKDYSEIDNSYFSLSTEDNQKITGILKCVANVMYLMALRINSDNPNKIYLDQNISIKFDSNGHGIKFDNRPVRIKNLVAPQDILQVLVSKDGDMYVNEFPLIVDKEYVSDMIKRAKKPLLNSKKMFI